jgi:hypothetical protein
MTVVASVSNEKRKGWECAKDMHKEHAQRTCAKDMPRQGRADERGGNRREGGSGRLSAKNTGLVLVSRGARRS